MLKICINALKIQGIRLFEGENYRVNVLMQNLNDFALPFLFVLGLVL
jgi:hypothetical protein